MASQVRAKKQNVTVTKCKKVKVKLCFVLDRLDKFEAAALLMTTMDCYTMRGYEEAACRSPSLYLVRNFTL